MYNIKGSCDYTKILSEIEQELRLGLLSKNDYIQILRDKNSIFENYKPIIDYYYNDKVMNEMLSTDFHDNLEALEEINKAKALYLQDKPNLELELVSNILKEINEINRII